MFSIANAIVSGHGFSSPYFEETGPTALETPGFPYFLAVLYYIGGGSRDFAFRALIGLNVVFSALTCVVLIAIGNRLRPRPRRAICSVGPGQFYRFWDSQKSSSLGIRRFTPLFSPF